MAMTRRTVLVAAAALATISRAGLQRQQAKAGRLLFSIRVRGRSKDWLKAWPN